MSPQGRLRLPASGLTRGKRRELAPTVARDEDSLAREHTYVLASSEKLGTVAAFSVIGLSGVAGVITDADSTHPTVRALRKRKVPVLHAP
jgi:DeoR/GlpR family transcriptional regulator of sugar metabolism